MNLLTSDLNEIVINETHNWYGVSEQIYEYCILPLDYDFEAWFMGNFIFCRYEEGSWNPLIIGEGDLKQLVANIKDEGLVSDKRATHIHCHLNSYLEDRLEEKLDIVSNYPGLFKLI